MGGFGRACRNSQGCTQGWACRPRMPPCAAKQVHMPSGISSGGTCRPALPLCRAMQVHPASPTPLSGELAPMTPPHMQPCCFSRRVCLSGRACRPVLLSGRAVHQPHHPCYQVEHAGQLAAMQVPTTSAVCQAGHAGQPCSHVDTTHSPTPCARQPCRPALPPMCSHKGAPLTPRSTRAHPLPLSAQCYAMEMDNLTQPHNAARRQGSRSWGCPPGDSAPWQQVPAPWAGSSPGTWASGV